MSSPAVTGSELTIDGTGFNGRISVRFGHLFGGTVTRISSTRIKVRVPDNAQSGTVTVTTPNGSASANLEVILA